MLAPGSVRPWGWRRRQLGSLSQLSVHLWHRGGPFLPSGGVSTHSRLFAAHQGAAPPPVHAHFSAQGGDPAPARLQPLRAVGISREPSDCLCGPGSAEAGIGSKRRQENENLCIFCQGVNSSPNCQSRNNFRSYCSSQASVSCA